MDPSRIPNNMYRLAWDMKCASEELNEAMTELLQNVDRCQIDLEDMRHQLKLMRSSADCLQEILNDVEQVIG